MANDFYSFGGYPAPHSQGASAGLRAELTNLSAGFDKMPGLSGNPLKIVRVDSTGTRLEAVDGSTLYLTAAAAATTYLTQAAAAGLYLPITTAASTYALKGGSNASGTWPVSITGNAATVSNITRAAYVGSDLNTLTTSGFYRIGNSEANRPNDFGQLLVMYGGADTITQIYGDWSSGGLYTRSGNPSSVGGFGGWSPWRTVVTDANITSFAPSVTGSGASGTWNINITGSAPWASITGKPTFDASPTASTVMMRDGAGDAYAYQFNQYSANGENPTVSQFMVTNGADNYFRKADVATVKTALGIGASSASIGASGYQQLPTGLILQWGTTPSVTIDTSSTFTFVSMGGIAFPNACLVAFVNPVGQTPNVGGTNNSMAVQSKSATGITVVNDAATGTATWFAIGY